MEGTVKHPELRESFGCHNASGKDKHRIGNKLFNTGQANPGKPSVVVVVSGIADSIVDEPAKIAAVPGKLHERILTNLLSWEHFGMCNASGATPWQEDKEPRQLHLMPRKRKTKKSSSPPALTPEDVAAAEDEEDEDPLVVDLASKKRKVQSARYKKPRKSPKKAAPPLPDNATINMKMQMIVFKFKSRDDSEGVEDEEEDQRPPIPLRLPFCRFVNELPEDEQHLRGADEIQELKLAKVWAAIEDQWSGLNEEKAYLWFEYSNDPKDDTQRRTILITSGMELAWVYALALKFEGSEFDGLLKVFCLVGRPTRELRLVTY